MENGSSFARPSNGQTIFAELRDIFAELYPEEGSARVVVADAGLDTKQIPFSSRAQTNWHNILAEAIRQARLDPLLKIALADYAANPALIAAYGQYRLWIDQGGSLEAPVSLPADADVIITGDVNLNQGDFVGRDKTTVGAINHSTAVAIGSGAIATVTITEESAYNVQGLANPYLGLRSFTYDDRGIYAGREQLAQETVQRLTAPGAQQTLLFITGASGSGKSSFAQAGLIPLLENHYAAYQRKMRHAIFRPSSQPLVMLADALQKLHPDLTPNTLARNTPKEQVNLLLIDQFEELFIQSEASQRSPFCDFLINLPSFTASRTHILITLRVDYLDALFSIQPLWEIAKEGAELRTMSTDDLRNAIQKPLQVKYPQKRVAPELLDHLVRDASADAVLLPLLQVTLAELWKTGKLVLSNYHSLTDAIRQHAEMVYAFSNHASAGPKTPRSSPEQQELMNILLDLINVSTDGTDHRDARQRRTRQELEWGAPQRQQMIEELVNARLLVAASETRHGESVEVIDIIHESLINNWDRLWHAIGKQRQQLQRRVRFKLRLGEWLLNGRKDGYLLLTDIQLAEARALVEEQDIEIHRKEARDFYWRSIEHHESAERRRVRNIRTTAMVIGLLFLLVAGAAGFSFYLNGQLGDRNTKLLNTLNVAFSRQLAAQSTTELNNGNYETAILLAIASGQVTDTIESYKTIRDALAHPWRSSTVLYGHIRSVQKAKWSRDESKVLTAGCDKVENHRCTIGSVRIWDVTTDKVLVTFGGYAGEDFEAIWSRDESKVLTSGLEGNARVWDAVTGKVLITFGGHIGAVKAKWSRDESKVLTVDGDGSARIWETDTGKVLVTFSGHTRYVYKAMWSRNESKVLTYGCDRGDNIICTVSSARIWDAATGQELVTFSGYTGDVSVAKWSRDESKVLTVDGDGSARIWEVATGKVFVTFSGHTGYVYEAIWSQDESKVLTYGCDRGDNICTVGSARIWDAATGQELVTFSEPTGDVSAAKWSRDESKVLTSGVYGSARIWDAATGQELVTFSGPTGDVSAAKWSQDESKVLTVDGDGSVHIWEAATGKVLVVLRGYTGTGYIFEATWNQDESKVLATGNDGSARIWEAATSQELITFSGHTRGVFTAKWSRDESKVLTAGCDKEENHGCTIGSVRIWDATTGRILTTFSGHTGFIFETRWNQDESKVLTVDGDGSARIWNAATGQKLVTFSGHTGGVYVAKWNQDEGKVLTVGCDREDNDTCTIGSVRIWNATTAEASVTLGGYMGRVFDAKWSRDESKVLTAGCDREDNGTCTVGSARIWDATTGQVLVTFDGHTGEVYDAQWGRDESKVLTTSADGSARIWDATTGQVLVTFDSHTGGVSAAQWSRDESKVLTTSADGSARIWDATTRQVLVMFGRYTGGVYDAQWSRDESKVLTSLWDNSVRIWDATTGQTLVILKDVSQATWNHDGNKILVSNTDGTVHIMYTHMVDLVKAACKWTPRNMSWMEWGAYFGGEGRTDEYTPICPNASIPPDAIAAIQDEVRIQIRAGDILGGKQRLEQLNHWLKENGQFAEYGVDILTLMTAVAATPTTEVTPP